jgi:hypothetical protein
LDKTNRTLDYCVGELTGRLDLEHLGGQEVAKAMQAELTQSGAAASAKERLGDAVWLPGLGAVEVVAEHENLPAQAPAARRSGALGVRGEDVDGHDGQPLDRADPHQRLNILVRALRLGADDGIRTRDPHLGKRKELFNRPPSGRIACCDAGSPATPAARGTILGTKSAIAGIRSSASQRVSPSHHGSAGLLRPATCGLDWDIG